MFIEILITLLFSLMFIIIYYIYVVFNYWPNREVPNIKPCFPFGNISESARRKISFTDEMGKFYDIAKQNGWNYVGLNFFHKNVLLLTDPSIVKHVMNTDFKNFYDRGFYYDEETEPLSAHLVALYGEKWKRMRIKLTPSFTPNKLKSMYEILLNCANKMSFVISQMKVLDIGYCQGYCRKIFS